MRVITHSCGVHDGCVEHDDCYDACHSSYGCGSWRAALCRRGCDAQAVSHWGAGNGASWARGGGPYQRTVDFVNRVPSPGECSCVAPGTQVATADGGQLPIEKLREGDVIWGFDVDAGVLVKSTVERLLVHRADYTLDLLVAEGGGELALTENHPVFTQRGYVRAEDLALGDSLVIVDEVAQQTRQERLIAILRRQSASTVTYNLKTTVGNYFAADMLIHNKCLSSDSMIDTPSGSVVITSVRPGDLVWGRRAGRQVESRVESVFKKTTILPSLSGRRVNDALSLTDNHVLAETGRPAGDLKAPHVDIEGAVYDLATDTGNYVAGGVLVEGARP